MAWVNPYKLRIGDYCGRLFNFDDPNYEHQEIVTKWQAKPQAICEYGSGSGGHLLELARRHPDSAVFGFEIRYKRSVRTVEKAMAQGLDNLYLLRIKAELALEVFPQAAFDAIYVNFPEPWDRPKRRKHRVLSEQMLDNSYQLLRPQGFLAIKTDHLDYFREFIETVSDDRRFLIVEQSLDLYSSSYLEFNIPTEFERLFCSQQIPICYAKIVINHDPFELTERGR